MKCLWIATILTAGAVALPAQQTAKPASKPAATATTSATNLPPGIPRERGVIKSAFALRYQDIKIGTGEVAEPNKMYQVLYTGWLAADGRKFDSSDDHRQPLKDKDGKPVLGDDGKPKLGDPQPINFPQGFGRVIPGFDQGFEGMRVEGKRRLFIPWQLAYGARGRPGPDPAHPGIPPKADLIFDIELVKVTDMQMPTARPGMMPGRPGTMPPHPQSIPVKPGAPATTTPGASATPAAPGSSSAPATTAQPNASSAGSPAQSAPAKPATPQN
jgi:peptidylprolyl isomerase